MMGDLNSGGAMPSARAASPSDLSPASGSSQSGIPIAGCDWCRDDEGERYLPMYGVAPHECYWRKGPEYTLGQSTLVPFTPDDCFVPDLEDDEDWSAFVYPAACGIFYCPNCDQQEYAAAWGRLTDRIGPPPSEVGQGTSVSGQDPQGLEAKTAGPVTAGNAPKGASHD